MQPVSCPSCGSQNISNFDDYKYNFESDKKYLTCTSIQKCNSCGLGFAYPMPSQEALNYYYSNVYRSGGRPVAKPQYDPYLFDLRYLTLAFDIFSTYSSRNYVSDESLSVLDFGAGNGELGVALKSINSNVQLIAVEPDLTSHAHLAKLGYQVFTSLEGLPPINILISNHSMEHLIDPSALIASCKHLMGANSLVGIEVPFCSMQQDFQSREYDSPHLTFWNTTSLLTLFEMAGIDVAKCYQYGRGYDEFFSEHVEILRNRSSSPFSWHKGVMKSLKQVIPSRLRLSLNILLGRNYQAPINSAAFRVQDKPETSLNCVRILGFV